MKFKVKYIRFTRAENRKLSQFTQKKMKSSKIRLKQENRKSSKKQINKDYVYIQKEKKL